MKNIKSYLMHILDECRFLWEKSKNLRFEEFNPDEVFKKTFVRTPEIIREVVKRISRHVLGTNISLSSRERFAGMVD